MLVLAGAGDYERYAANAFSCRPARSSIEAVTLLKREPPTVLLIDWDTQADAQAVCAAVGDRTAVLGLIGDPAQAPAALRAGCQGLLLKPVIPNLLAARLGRLVRERMSFPTQGRQVAIGERGTNRLWSQTSCPSCGQGGAIGFEFSSRRRSWYACLGCDGVWLGPRQE
jgi:DNA-binding response OmpR family regulator